MKNKNNSKHLLLALLPFFGMVIGILIFAIGILPITQSFFVEKAATPLDLVKGYRSWYYFLSAMTILGCIVIIIIDIIAFILMVRHARAMDSGDLKNGLGLFVGVLVLAIVLTGAIFIREKIPQLITNANADVQALESNQLETQTVWLTYDGEGRLKGPYFSGCPNPVQVYSGIAPQSYEYIDFLIPKFIPFQLDQNRPFDENQSINWNQENAAMYQISYTPNFYVVTDIQPVN